MHHTMLYINPSWPGRTTARKSRTKEHTIRVMPRGFNLGATCRRNSGTFLQTIPDHESKSGFTPSISHFLNFPLYILSRAMCSYDLRSAHSPTLCTLSRTGKTVTNYTRTTGSYQYFHSDIRYLASTSYLRGNNKGTRS